MEHHYLFRGMNRRDELERLRLELKRKVDAIIDEAISRVEGS